ncbi:MAG: hypothetical protein Q9195_008329 [Heterodermia aff. obscurata]
MKHDSDTKIERYEKLFRNSKQKFVDVEDVSDANSYAPSQINRKLISSETLNIGNERYEKQSEYVIVLRVLTRNEIERYALKTEEIRKKRKERAGQILAKHGIDPANLSKALFASFQSQNPAIQERSIQVYLQNLARNQRKDASLSNAETMSESRNPNHRHHLAEDALAGFEATELLNHHKANQVKTDSNEN